ncbi:MAG: hypothetical protein ABI889_01215 [Gemmatimonadota bacterium]
MRHQEGTSFIPAGVRSLALVAALLACGAALPAPLLAQDATAPPQQSSVADSSRAPGPPSSVPNAKRIRRVIDEGTHVVLTDGTVWEIYLPDRPSVNMWRSGDLLVVRDAAVMQGEFDFTLKDGRTRKPVSARLVGDLSSRS